MYGVYFRICKNISIHTHTHICVYIYTCIRGFPGCSDGKESAWNAGDLDSIPGLGWSPGKEKGYPLQYSCRELYGQRSLAGYGPWDRRVRHNWATKTNMCICVCICVCMNVYMYMYIPSFLHLFGDSRKKSQVWNEHSKNWNISDSRFHFVIQLLLKNFCLKKFWYVLI